MYDKSLLEKYDEIEYHVEVFDLVNRREYTDKKAELSKLVIEHDKNELARIMKANQKEDGLKVIKRQDYFSEKLGTILVHVEWITYKRIKVSPHIGNIKTKIINESALDF